MSIGAVTGDKATDNTIADSWIEVSSQPSSSSLSSAADDTTNEFRVQHDSNSRRRRQLVNVRGGLQMAQRSHSAGGSSQDEYEESESESDRLMTSSNEGLVASPLQTEWRPGPPSTTSSDNLGDAEDDGDENATTINVPRGQAPAFQPQPNAFNRPPSQHIERPHMSRQDTATYPYTTSSRPALRHGSQRHSYPTQPTQHNPFNVISPSYQADQDAALRASLSTLLSCAAAARGLPKSSTAANASAPAPSARIEPSALRIVPESVALGGSPSPSSRHNATATTTAVPAAARQQQQLRSPRSRSADKSKRSSAEKDRRAAKKRRSSAGPGQRVAADGAAQSTYGFGTSSVDEVSPTLLTWVVSAGIVVLVGALSFSTGYAMGKEVGRTEAMSGVGCGREAAVAARGSGGTLRRLRWSDGLTV